MITIESKTPALIAAALTASGWEVHDYIINADHIKGIREADELEKEMKLSVFFTRIGTVSSAYLIDGLGRTVDVIHNGTNKAGRVVKMIERHGVADSPASELSLADALKTGNVDIVVDAYLREYPSGPRSASQTVNDPTSQN